MYKKDRFINKTCEGPHRNIIVTTFMEMPEIYTYCMWCFMGEIMMELFILDANEMHCLWNQLMVVFLVAWSRNVWSMGFYIQTQHTYTTLYVSYFV